KAPHDRGELLRELLDGRMDEAGGFRIAIGEQLVQPFLTDLITGLIAQGIFAGLAQSLAPFLQYGLKSPLARPVADEPFGAPQLRIVGVNRDEAQVLGAVGEQWRDSGFGGLCHGSCQSYDGNRNRTNGQGPSSHTATP